MLQYVFKELYDQGVLVFLSVDNYVTNNDEIDHKIFEDRNKFLEMYDEPIELGWVYCYTSSLNNIIDTIQEDTCCMIDYGFNSDTEKKALQVGRILVNSLIKYKFMAPWNEKVLNEHKVSTVITTEDLPENIQEMINVRDY